MCPLRENSYTEHAALRHQSNPGVDVGGAGASTLRGWGAALGAPPPSMAEIMSPNGFACCARGGGIAK